MSEQPSDRVPVTLCLDRDVLELIEVAAFESGQSVGDFAAAVLAEASRRVLSDRCTTILSDRDRDLFLARLEKQEPNDALKAAARKSPCIGGP